MKKHALQLSLILLSVVALTAAGVSLFKAAQESGAANLFDSTPASQEESVPLSYETRISKGDQLYNAAFFDLAATEFALAIKIDDKQSEAHRKLGKTYWKLLKYSDALYELERAYELDPGDDNRSNYGLALIRTDNVELAKEILSKVGENHQSGQFILGLLFAYEGDYENAKIKFSKAGSLSGPILPALIQNFQNAFAAYEAQQGGQDIYLRALLIKAMVDAEEFPLAENLALKVLNEKNDYRDVWVLLGYSQLKMKKLSEAEDAFKEAKSLDAVKPETHYFLGITHYEQGEYSEAVDSFELALLYDFEPESEAYRKLAESQNFLGNFEDSLAAYEYLVKIDQSDVNLFAEPLRIAMDILGDLDRALTLAAESTSYFPGEAASHTYLANVYIKRGELDLALTAVDTALDIDPNSAEAHFTLGELKLAQGNNEEAKDEFKKSYELSKPGDALSVEAAERYNSLITPQ